VSKRRAYQHLDRYTGEESQSKFDGMAEKVGSLGQSLQRRISNMEDLIRTSNGKDRQVDEQNSAALSSLQRSLTSVASAGSVIPANIFFDIPQPVNCLRDISLKPKDGDPIHKQQRFVICGISGSGKTQFCCEFADQNRERLVSRSSHTISHINTLVMMKVFAESFTSTPALTNG
jgi:ABC-type histidine transport system ATPase subunit